MTNTPSISEDITAQARQLREHHPALHEYLIQRERAIKQALAQTMEHLAPGISDLTEFAIPEPITQAGATQEAIIEG